MNKITGIKKGWVELDKSIDVKRSVIVGKPKIGKSIKIGVAGKGRMKYSTYKVMK